MWSSLRGRCGCSCEHLEGLLLLLRLLTALGFQFPWEPARALNSFSALIRSASCFSIFYSVCLWTLRQHYRLIDLFCLNLSQYKTNTLENLGSVKKTKITSLLKFPSFNNRWNHSVSSQEDICLKECAREREPSQVV